MRPHGRASINPSGPRALGVCDRCGFLYNHNKLDWQFQWVGTQLQNLRILVCPTCMDAPQEQLRTILIPPDPIPIDNPRPEPYTTEVPNYLSTLSSNNLTTVSSLNLITQIDTTPTPTSSGFTGPSSVSSV